MKDSLDVALRRHLEADLDELPVVDADDPTQVVGLTSRRDIIAAYHRQMHEPK